MACAGGDDVAHARKRAREDGGGRGDSGPFRRRGAHGHGSPAHGRLGGHVTERAKSGEAKSGVHSGTPARVAPSCYLQAGDSV